MTKLTLWERATLPPTPYKALPRHILWLTFAALVLPLALSGAWYYLLLLPLLWRLMLVDISYHLLPNIYVLLLGALGLSIAALTPELSLMASAVGVFGGLLGGLIINFIIAVLTGHKGGLGGGDIKFLVAAGAWLGIGLLPVVLWLAFFFMLPTFFLRKQAALPFGPALILAFWLTLLFKNTAAGLILALPLPI